MNQESSSHSSCGGNDCLMNNVKIGNIDVMTYRMQNSFIWRPDIFSRIIPLPTLEAMNHSQFLVENR